MPSAGRQMSAGTATLAVGKPSSRPRPSPRRTTPRTSWSPPEHGRRPRPLRPRPAAGGSGSTTPAGRPRSPRPTRSRPCDVEAQLGAHAAQQRHVALAAVAEMEVLAHDHGPGVEMARQHLSRSPRPTPATAPVEAHDQRVVDAGRGQQLELLVEVGQQLRRRLRPHDRGRVAVEGHDRRRAPSSAAMARTWPITCWCPRCTPS